MGLGLSGPLRMALGLRFPLLLLVLWSVSESDSALGSDPELVDVVIVRLEVRLGLKVSYLGRLLELPMVRRRLG